MTLIHVNNSCNQKCVFCLALSRGSSLDNIPAVWIKRALKDKDSFVQITGGEPFLCDPDQLIEFCSFLLKKGKKIELQTNASSVVSFALPKLRVLGGIIKASGGYFNVNFSAPDPRTDFAVTRSRGAFVKRLEGIRLLRTTGAKIRLTFVINRKNYAVLPVFSEFVVHQRAFIDWIQFSFVKGAGLGDGLKKKIIPRYSEVSPYLIKAMEILKKNGMEFEVDHIPPCFLGKYWRRNVDLWKMLKGVKGPHLKEKKKPGTCRGCVFYKFCPGPRTDYLQIYKKL